MDTEFDRLKGEYSSKTTTEERRSEIKNQMCENLKKRNNNSNIFPNGIILDKENLKVEDLYMIDGELNRKAASDRMTECAQSAREQLLRMNRFSPDNPYPNNN